MKELNKWVDVREKQITEIKEGNNIFINRGLLDYYNIKEKQEL